MCLLHQAEMDGALIALSPPVHMTKKLSEQCAKDVWNMLV